MARPSRLRRTVARAARVRLRRLIRPILKTEPHLAAKYFPYEPEAMDYLVPKPAPREGEALPVPPASLWVATGPGGYGDDDEAYLRIGREQVATMLELAAEHGFRLPPAGRVLDFGCASGRLIRWFDDHARSGGEVWGVDVSAEHIVWCQRHLTPPFRFATTTTAPHLPFEDRWFDWIHAGSVFTQIDELADAWLLELRRILSPEGRLYITVNDKHSMEILARHPEFNLAQLIDEAKRRIPIDRTDFAAASIRRAYSLYDREWLLAKLEGIFRVVAVKPEAYGFQTGILLARK